jgi:FG-GAP repeat
MAAALLSPAGMTLLSHLLIVFWFSDVVLPGATASEVGVREAQKISISDTRGAFPSGLLDNSDHFGGATASLGDLDGDNTNDLVVGAALDDDGGPDRGAVYVLFLRPDGTVRAEQKISTTEGNFRGVLNTNDQFGISVASLGDLDGDATQELVVGAFADDDGGPNRGAVYVLFLNPNGTVKAEQKISDTQGNFRGALNNSDQFGISVTGLSDLAGNDTTALAVGARLDNDGGRDRGAVYVLFLHPNGTVKSEQKISDTQGNFKGALDNDDQFGSEVAGVGDIDGDMAQDLSFGARFDGDGGPNRGAVYMLFLHPNGTVKAEQKISDTHGNFQGVLDRGDQLGIAITGLGDVDGDATNDIAVGANGDDDGGTNRGAVYLLFLNPNGTVKAEQKISDTKGSFQGVLDNLDQFGVSATSLGDLDGDLVQDLAVGAVQDGDGGYRRGAVYVLFLNQTTNPSTTGSLASSSSRISTGAPTPSSPEVAAATTDSSSSGSTTFMLVMACSVAALCLVAIVILLVILRRRRRGGTPSREESRGVHEEDMHVYDTISPVRDSNDSEDSGEYHGQCEDAGEYHNVLTGPSSEEAGEYHNRQSAIVSGETELYHNVRRPV